MIKQRDVFRTVICASCGPPKFRNCEIPGTTGACIYIRTGNSWEYRGLPGSTGNTWEYRGRNGSTGYMGVLGYIWECRGILRTTGGT